MKRLLIILACTIGINANAQQKPFKIDGEVMGTDTFKYVYAFDNEHKLIQRSEVVDGKFLLKGVYNSKQRFGAIAFAAILLSNSDANIDAILADRPLSKRRHYTCSVILEEQINLKYNTDKKSFLIDGGPLNKVQNKFESIYSSYRKRRDSAYASLDKINTDDEEGKVSEAKRLFKEAVDQMIGLVGENPNSEASLLNFNSIIFDQLTAAVIVEGAYNLFSVRLKSSETGIRIKKLIDDKISQEKQLENPPYTLGMKLPYFEILNNEDKLIKSTAVFGKYTFVDFWATWCVPCRQETPNLITAHSKFSNKGFKIVTISIDDKSAHKKWIEVIASDKMNEFVNLFNGNDVLGLAKELKITAIPANFLVDSTGRIIAVNLRGEELQNKLKELIP